MAIPSTTLSTLETQLDTFFEFALEQASDQFIASKVFPIIDVMKASGDFGLVPIEELLENVSGGERNSGSGYARDSFQFTKGSYACQEYGFEEVVDDREAAVYNDYVKAGEIAVMRATFKLLAAYEARVAAMVFNTSTYTGSLDTAVANGQWTSASSTPITDVENAVQAFYAQSGQWPNALVMNRQVYRQLRLNPQVVASLNGAGAGDRATARDVTVEQLQAVFDIPNILVAGGSKNTANHQSAASISQIWGKHVMVCKIATSADMKEPCIGRTFHYGADGSRSSGRIDVYREEAIRSDVVRARHDSDEVLLYTEMGNLIPNVIA